MVIFLLITKIGCGTCLQLGLLESGRQDSNLRPSAPKTQEMFFKRIVRTRDIIRNLSDIGSFLRQKKWPKYYFK